MSFFLILKAKNISLTPKTKMEKYRKRNVRTHQMKISEKRLSDKQICMNVIFENSKKLKVTIKHQLSNISKIKKIKRIP